jgi:tetratricopeptide (TPR) repeat protein
VTPIVDAAAAAGPEAAPTVPGPQQRRTPAQLPADVAFFIGRDSQLDDLTSVLGGPTGDNTHRAALITAIGGTAGVGKTALAVHWAHRVRVQFPDGQLYLNLRGYDPERPMQPADALAAMLRSLGVPAADVPVDLAERAAVYRSVLDGQRILLLLDNASSVEQVRHLLPGSSSCFALVTSRDSLGGLVARYGAHRIELDLLPPGESLTLLRSMIGARVDREPVAAAALAEQCARLPLALRVAAELAAARPERTLSALTAELIDEGRRLELLDAGGDARTAISTVFSWSYEHLPEDTARMFRLLSLHPGADLDAYAAAALAGVSAERARRLLDQLVRAHLIHRTAPDRYGMHDLLRAYADGIAVAAGSEQDRRLLSLRLSGHYIATSAAAVSRLGAGGLVDPAVVDPADGPGFANREDASAWVDTELANLVSVCLHATARGELTTAPYLSSILVRALLASSRHHEGRAIHTAALDAARAAGDQRAEARALASLGTSCGQAGSYQDAEAHLIAAIRLGHVAADESAEALAMRSLALVHWHLGRHGDAIELGRRALTVSRACGDPLGTAAMLLNQAGFLWRQGRIADALRDLTESLSIYQENVYPYGLAQTLSTIAEIHRRQGRYAESANHVRQALDTACNSRDRAGEGVALRDLGSLRLCQGDYDGAATYLLRAVARLERVYPNAGAHALSQLGEVRRGQGRYAEAIAIQERALAYFRTARDQGGEGEALTRLALARHALGEHDNAAALLTTALALACRGGIRYAEADAHAGLGRVCMAKGDDGRRHLQRALSIYHDLGAPEADETRELLEACGR